MFAHVAFEAAKLSAPLNKIKHYETPTAQAVGFLVSKGGK